MNAKGSLFEVKHRESLQTLHIFCSNEKNYKFQMIMSYVLEEVGFKVCQLEQNDGVG